MVLFKRLDRVVEGSVCASGGVAIGIMCLLAVFICIQVFCRYVLNVHIQGLFALAVVGVIVFPFLMASYTLSRGHHVSIDFMTSRLSESARIGLAIAVYLASLAFTIILGFYSGKWAYGSFGYEVAGAAEGLPLPLGALISVMVLGCLLLTMQIIRMIVYNIRSLLEYDKLSATFSARLRDNPLLCILTFIVAISISIVLLIHGNPIVGLAFITLVLLFSGMPIFLALGLAGIASLYFLISPASLLQIPVTAYQGIAKFPLCAIPLFVLGGMIMEQGKVIERIFTLLRSFSGRFPVSPLLVTIGVGGFFCAVTGSSVGATAAVAAALIPILIRQGYSKSLCAGVVAGSTVGALIPPSSGFIVYGVITEESIAGLFIGALVPAAVLFGFYFVYVILIGIFNKRALYDKGQLPSEVSLQQVSRKDTLLLLKKASWGLFTPVFVLGGIYAGIFTPTEAAAVMVIYAIVVTMFIMKTLTWRDLVKGATRGAHLSAMVLWIIITALILGLTISQLRITPDLVAWSESAELGAIGVLGIIFIVLLILGMFLAAGAILVITLPVFYPVAMAVGLNGIWLGVFYEIVLEVGLLTPPVGLNLFAIQAVSDVPLNTIIRGVLPFIGMMLLTVVIIYFFPELVTWLPSTMM